MDDFHALAAARRARTQAKQVPIYRVKKDGMLAARPTCFEPKDRVATRIESLEALNPGSRYEGKYL